MEKTPRHLYLMDREDPNPTLDRNPDLVTSTIGSTLKTVHSNRTVYSNDEFISRTMSKSVAPPHTASSLKQHICKIEGFEGPGSFILYPSLSEQSAVDGAARLSLRGDLGPGLSVLDPIALVVPIQADEKRFASVGAAKLLVEWVDRSASRYVHYRLFEASGEVCSKAAFNEDDTSLGRIEVFSVAPPHTVASLKSCITKAEGMSGLSLQAFEDEEGEVTMKDADRIDLLADTYLGIAEDKPIAMVYEPQKKAYTPDVAPDLAPNFGSFTKQLKCTYNFECDSDDPNWHSLKPGEIFQTNGVLRTERYRNGESKCYQATNSEGTTAFVAKAFVQFC